MQKDSIKERVKHQMIQRQTQNRICLAPEVSLSMNIAIPEIMITRYPVFLLPVSGVQKMISVLQ